MARVNKSNFIVNLTAGGLVTRAHQRVCNVPSSFVTQWTSVSSGQIKAFDTPLVNVNLNPTGSGFLSMWYPEGAGSWTQQSLEQITFGANAW